MIKLLLVDDEPLVLVGLQTMLAWDKYGIEICGTARNGGQALDMIEKLRPDIVITDVMMPAKSGLELLAASREAYGRVPVFIILTCVEEFHHVKEAIRGQAVDYLIKLELTPEILAQSITNAIEMLGSLRKTPVEGFGMQPFYDRFFIELFNNQFESTDEFEQRKAELGIDLSYDAYVVCYCELDSPSNNALDNNQLMNLYTSTARMMWETVNKYVPCYTTSLDLRHFVITFCLREDTQDYRHVLTNVLEQGIETIKNYFNVGLTCCVGVKASSALSISDSFYTARSAITAGDRKRPIHFCNIKSHASHIVTQVKEYIRQNLDKRLGLNQVSDVFGFSPKYISMLFAKHAGCSFVEYINAEKIARARELLLVNNARVYEISEQLGFESSFYFSKVFKKHTGLSPRDYIRKNM